MEMVPAGAGATRRQNLIRQLEASRNSRVLTYVLSDRQGATAQIAEDAVRPLYDHLRAMGRVPSIDLFLYSVGGFTDVPWRIVTMIREYADRFGVIVPYKAMSAATMIALGADEIVLGPKGELGPIDPQLSVQHGREGGTPVQEQLSVEDIMSYLRLLRERVGLSDQAALAAPVAILAQKLDPWILGQINRAHSHIRTVARKLLTARSAQGTPLDEQKIGVIIETLAEKTYQHGHAIGRREAAELGLPVTMPGEQTESLMWELLESYEDLCELRSPIDGYAVLGDINDMITVPVVVGAIESTALAHSFAADLVLTRRRQMPAQFNLNLQMAVNLPAGIPTDQLPAAAQAAIQQLLAQLQQQAAGLVQEELRRQAATIDIHGRLQGGAWRLLDGWSPAM